MSGATTLNINNSIFYGDGNSSSAFYEINYVNVINTIFYNVVVSPPNVNSSNEITSHTSPNYDGALQKQLEQMDEQNNGNISGLL